MTVDLNRQTTRPDHDDARRPDIWSGGPGDPFYRPARRRRTRAARVKRTPSRELTTEPPFFGAFRLTAVCAGLALLAAMMFCVRGWL